jgi:hypothetical protein
MEKSTHDPMEEIREENKRAAAARRREAAIAGLSIVGGHVGPAPAPSEDDSYVIEVELIRGNYSRADLDAAEAAGHEVVPSPWGHTIYRQVDSQQQ